jgi:hypothetical protein
MKISAPPLVSSITFLVFLSFVFSGIAASKIFYKQSSSVHPCFSTYLLSKRSVGEGMTNSFCSYAAFLRSFSHSRFKYRLIIYLSFLISSMSHFSINLYAYSLFPIDISPSSSFMLTSLLFEDI